jgi:hypothetical protein
MQGNNPVEKYKLLADSNNLLCTQRKKILMTLSLLRRLVFAGGG